MKTNTIIDISPTHPPKFWVSSQSNCRKWMMKFILCMLINMEVVCKVILSFWVSVTRHAQSTQKFVYLWNISIIAWGMRLIFCLQINTIFVFRVIMSLSVRIARQVQSTKNNQFTISLQNLKEKWRIKLIFLLLINVEPFSKLILSF